MIEIIYCEVSSSYCCKEFYMNIIKDKIVMNIYEKNKIMQYKCIINIIVTHKAT